jgi:hypothetical protein
MGAGQSQEEEQPAPTPYELINNSSMELATFLMAMVLVVMCLVFMIVLILLLYFHSPPIFTRTASTTTSAQSSMTLTAAAVAFRATQNAKLTQLKAEIVKNTQIAGPMNVDRAHGPAPRVPTLQGQGRDHGRNIHGPQQEGPSRGPHPFGQRATKGGAARLPPGSVARNGVPVPPAPAATFESQAEWLATIRAKSLP